MKLPQCSIIELPKIPDHRGNLSFIEGENHVPFSIKRVYYLYDVPGGESRAGHALKTCHAFIVAISGSFDIHIDNGEEKETFQLNRSYYGLHMPPMCWRFIDNFSSGAVCLVLASELYSSDAYYRDYDDFLKIVHANR